MPQKPLEGGPAKTLPPLQKVRKVAITRNESGQRLDNFLLKILSGVPRSAVYRIIRSGEVRVNSGRVKPDRRLQEGDEVRVPPVRRPDETAPVRPPDDVLNRLRDAIIFEDEHYLALNKPAGLASHGGSGIMFGVIEAARAWGVGAAPPTEALGGRRGGNAVGTKYDYLELCHRLDRDTSGVLLLAKSRPALLRAQAALREGKAQKRYRALLCGRWQGGSRDVDSALLKNRLSSGERFVLVDEQGKPSRTRFTPVERFAEATLCEVDIFSGRMHQIRVHAADIGHPVAGDRKYGQADDKRPLRDLGLRRTFLHAFSLRLPAAGPPGAAGAGSHEFPALLVESALPTELGEFLKKLK